MLALARRIHLHTFTKVIERKDIRDNGCGGILSKVTQTLEGENYLRFPRQRPLNEGNKS